MARGYVFIITAMLIWGSVGVFARFAGAEPLIAVLYRLLFGGATIALALLAGFGRQKAEAASGAVRRHLPMLLLSGLALAANWLFFFKALASTSVSNAVLSYYAAPVIVALASPALLGERLERRTILATALAFSGLFVMLYQPGRSVSAADAAGIGYGLIAACFYATVTITGRWLVGVDAVRQVLVQCTVAAAVLVPVVAGWGGGLSAMALPAGSLLLLLVVGAVHTAFALILYFEGLRRVKVQHVGVLAYLDPVSAVLFALVFLGEVPAGPTLMGGALVLAASAMLLRRRGVAEAAGIT